MHQSSDPLPSACVAASTVAGSCRQQLARCYLERSGRILPKRKPCWELGGGSLGKTTNLIEAWESISHPGGSLREGEHMKHYNIHNIVIQHPACHSVSESAPRCRFCGKASPALTMSQGYRLSALDTPPNMEKYIKKAANHGTPGLLHARPEEINIWQWPSETNTRCKAT